MSQAKAKPGEEFLGVGIKVPLERSDTVDFATVAGRELILSAIFTILRTKATFESSQYFAMGERFMRDDFGSKHYTIRHENINPATIALLESHYIEAIERWEPRVTITQVQSKTDNENIETRINTVINTTNTPANFVIIRNQRGAVTFRNLNV